MSVSFFASSHKTPGRQENAQWCRYVWFSNHRSLSANEVVKARSLLDRRELWSHNRQRIGQKVFLILLHKCLPLCIAVPESQCPSRVQIVHSERGYRHGRLDISFPISFSHMAALKYRPSKEDEGREVSASSSKEVIIVSVRVRDDSRGDECPSRFVSSFVR